MVDTGLSVTENKEKWIEARYDSVTATDLGKILGVDHDVSRRKLLESKLERRDLLDGCSDMTRTLVTLGQTFESSAREAFKTLWAQRSQEEDVGFVPTMHTHKDLTWFTGSPDYLIPGKKVVVEFKTHFYPSIDMARPILNVLSIPLKYYLQVQGYLEIMNYDCGILVSWTLRNGMRIFGIQRDQNLWAHTIYPAINEFHRWMEEMKGKPLERGFGVFERGQKMEIMEVILTSLRNHAEELYYLPSKLNPVQTQS